MTVVTQIPGYSLAGFALVQETGHLTEARPGPTAVTAGAASVPLLGMTYSSHFVRVLELVEQTKASIGWKISLIDVSSYVVILDVVTHPLDPAGPTFARQIAFRRRRI